MGRLAYRCCCFGHGRCRSGDCGILGRGPSAALSKEERSVLRLFGGARHRPRTVRTFVVFVAAFAVAAIVAGSASASFPPPGGANSWYVSPSVSGSITYFFPTGIGSHPVSNGS